MSFSRESKLTLTSVVLVALAAFLLAAPAAYGQVTSGTIFGAVQDPGGALVPNATVVVQNPAVGVTRTVQSSGDGGFVVPNLPPGTYKITVDAQGFKKLEKTDVVLSAADRLNAGVFTLAVGATADTVTVTADSGQIQLQSNSGERSDVITSKQLNDVAINGRNVLDYMKLIPGVASTFSGAVSGTGGIDGFNVNGTRANEHEFTLDGASNVDTGNNGGTHVTLNPDAIEEVKVLTSNYQAEFGKAAGGQVAIVTKSGTNQWHGDGRFFHRNEGLNANEWFNKQSQQQEATPRNTPPLYRYNDVGYQVGGPILKDKLFAFWSQEFYRQLIPTGGTIQFYTPTQLERQGDFSQSTDGDGKPVAISGPGISNNKIDPTQLPAAQQAVFTQVQKILNLYPLPNISGFGANGQAYNYSISLSAHAPRREDILRVDYQLNSSNRIFGRWIHNSETDSSPFTGGSGAGPYGVFACDTDINFPGGCTQKHPGWNFSLNWVSTITPRLLNEFSVGPSHTYSLVDGVNGNISRGANNIDLPLLFPVDPSQSIPDMGFNDMSNVKFGSSYLGGTPWHQANTTINVNDNITWVKDRHTFKAGFFYQRSRKDQIAWENVNGVFDFTTGPTAPDACPGGDGTCAQGDPLASALIGEFRGFDQTTKRVLGKFRYNQAEFYVQDTWKVLPRLTLDYGMRFAWIPPQYDANNGIALFDPSFYNSADAVTINPADGNIIVADGGNRLNGIRLNSDGTLPQGGWDSRGIMPEPRFGFAYDLLGNHKTVLRGGFGMMHDRVQGNLIFDPTFRNVAVVQKPHVSANNIANLPTISTASDEVSTQADKAVIGAARDGKVPTVYSFSLGVQHELTRGTTFDLAYVGTMSRHLVTAHDINAVPYGTAFTWAAQDPANYPGGVVPDQEPGLNPIYAAAGLDYSGQYAYGHPAYTNAALVPFKGYGQIPYLEFNGTSNYNSLQASVQRRFSRSLTVGAVYTWSKALGTANTDEDYRDSFYPALDYRAMDFDRTHVFAANYVYDLPNLTKHFGGPKWLSYLTDNYQLSGVTQFMTGTPADTNNNWSIQSGALDGGNMWGMIQYYWSYDQAGNLLTPPLGTPLRATRDLLRNGHMQNWDMSLFKNFPLGSNEARYLQLRLEAFNAFNHPNFDTINYGVSVNDFPFQWQPSDPISLSKTANWGKPQDTYNSSGGPGGFRVVQLAAKIYF